MKLIERPSEVDARLRHKNQLTLPDPVARALDARVDDRLLFEIDPTEPGVVRLRVLPRDFAGSMTGVYGTTGETLAFVRGERDAWGE
jgi:bifunctional DNA-binding transcriptional regulator/antitoxin component of YhaV-PrlF toxin-antitoxin module